MVSIRLWATSTLSAHLFLSEAVARALLILSMVMVAMSTKPMLTEPLTLLELADYFRCNRNDVKKEILDKYSHETVGTKYRVHVTE